MDKEEKKHFREEFMEGLGLHKDTGKEIDRTPFNDKYDWVCMECRNELGQPTWFANLQLKPNLEEDE